MLILALFLLFPFCRNVRTIADFAVSKIQVSSVRASLKDLLKASEDKRRNFNETVELQSEYSHRTGE